MTVVVGSLSNEAISRQMKALLEDSAALHRHLCPRQVLGVRMGQLAAIKLGLALPQPQKVKRLLTIVETDGCFSDGVSVATNCWVGRRTLRIEDYGKVAATFVDTKDGRAIRISPSHSSRAKARQHAPGARNRWSSYLQSYQALPLEDLFRIEEVTLRTSIESIVSAAGRRTNCQRCGEEIINEREVRLAGELVCRFCAGDTYYQPVLIDAAPAASPEDWLMTNSVPGNE